jgi:replicative DNA helicase
MLKNDLISQTPLSLIEGGYDEARENEYKGKFGAVMARAGVGKTALLVQIAFPALLDEKNILHVSLSDPIDKVRLTYKSTYQSLVDRVEDHDANDAHKFWERMEHHKFVVNLKRDGFSAARIEEQLKGLSEQEVAPAMILIDGLDFDTPMAETLTALKGLAEKHGIPVWFTVQTHRHEEPGAKGLPVQLEGIDHLFHKAIWIKPEESSIKVETVIGGEGAKTFTLNPTTMTLE